MAYSSTVDERYGGGIYSTSSGYNDASNLLNEIFVISEGGVAYGTNVDAFFSADIDTYSLGILSPGEYIVDVDDYTWDYTNFEFGSVSTVQVFNSTGYQVASSYGTYADLNFTVNSSDTFYVSITGPSFGEAQYSVSYSKIETDSPTLFDIPTYTLINDDGDGNIEVGETLSINTLASDGDGISSISLNWYSIKDGTSIDQGVSDTYEIKESDAGNQIQFQVVVT